MASWTALTTLPGKDAAEALGLAMEEMEPAPSGVGVFELEDGSALWEVGGYFEEAPDGVALALLAAAPVIAAYLIFQKRVTEAVMISAGVKG